MNKINFRHFAKGGYSYKGATMKDDIIFEGDLDVLRYQANLMKKPNSNGRWCRGCRARGQVLRYDFCKDCCDKAEAKTLERSVLAHLLKCLYNVCSFKFMQAKFDLQWAWERFTNTGDYHPVEIYKRNRIALLTKKFKTIDPETFTKAAKAMAGFGASIKEAMKGMEAFGRAGSRAGEKLRYKIVYPLPRKILTIMHKYKFILTYTYPGTTFKNHLKDCFGFICRGN